MEEKEAFVLLNHIPFLGPQKVQKLLSHFGFASQVISAPIELVTSLLGKKDKSLPYFATCLQDTAWKEDLSLINKEGITLLTWRDKEYPSSLKALKDPPFLLYIKGAIQEDDSNAIGIVGTRNCTVYGKEMAEQFGKDTAAAGYTVISGLARGVDSYAHLGALKGGRTLAVLGSGLSFIYPKENEGLANEIAKKGALISEYPMKMPPDKFHFPQRNRIVSALSAGMLLVEAPLKSGAMITVNYSLNLGKKCFTISGRIDTPTFAGNHFLIKEQKARLVENAQEMVSLLSSGSKGAHKSVVTSTKPFFNLTPEEETIMRLLVGEENSIEELATMTNFSMATLSSLLMGLVLKKKIREFPGKLYRKVI